MCLAITMVKENQAVDSSSGFKQDDSVASFENSSSQNLVGRPLYPSKQVDW